MKKLYRKGTVHPTPPLISDHLSFLPATILTLTVALSPEDREVLAYLISCSSSNFSGNRKSNNKSVTATSRSTSSGGGGTRSGDDHPPSFNCYCFRCYMSYWIRWDSSPNRQLIHEIIDAYEDSLLVQNKKDKGKRERRKGKGSAERSGELKVTEPPSTSSKEEEIPQTESAEETNSRGDVAGGGGDVCGADKECSDKGSVRRFVSFLGEKIWGVWN